MDWQPPEVASNDSGWQPPEVSGSGQSDYSWSGLGQNALQDAGRQIIGTAMQVKQGLYDVPKAVITAPAQVLQGTPIGQTDLANFTRQNTQGMAQGIGQFASDPIGSMYRNPVTTGMIAYGAATKAIPAAQWLATKGMSAALGPSEEAINARLANPEAIANAPSYADIAQQLPDALNSLKKQISDHSEQAFSTLRDSTDPSQGAMPKSQLVDIWGSLMKKLQTDDTLVGPARKAAADKLTSIVDDSLNVAKGSPNLSEQHLKGILQSIDEDVNWQDKNLSSSNSILTDLRGQTDQFLKNGNQDYAQAMQPVADKVGLLEALKSAFNITNKTGEGLQPTDTTISKIQALPSERKSITQGLANQLNQATGQDLLQQSKNYGYARQFQGGSPNGSRRVNAFGAAGAGAGEFIGSQLGMPGVGATTGAMGGAGVGLMVDKYGGPIAAALADRYAPVSQGISRLIASAPAQSLNRAALVAYVNQLLNRQNASQGSSQ